MKEDICGIYQIKNIINGKVYVGQSCHINRRFIEHRSSLNHGVACNKYLQRSWDKYGEQSFEFSVLEECMACDLDEREIYWINKLNALIAGYNLTVGGGGCRGYKMPKESVERIRCALKGKPKSESAKKKSGIGIKKWHETHLNPSSIRVVCLNTGEDFPNAGIASKKYASTIGTNIRRCCTGELRSCGNIDGERLVWADYKEYKTLSPDQIKDRITYANSPYCGLKSPNSKKVLCVTTGEVFPTMREAAAKFGIHETLISACCRGKHKHACGMEWQYYTA